MHRANQILLIAVAVSGCGILGADEERVIGRVDTQRLDEHVSIPDTVSVGIPFTVRVLTSGDGCDRKDSTASTVEGNSATIVPYDRRKLGRNCVSIQVLFDHAADVVFSQPGSGEVIIVARSISGEALEITRGVWVQ